MTQVWHHITLSDGNPQNWVESSYLHRLVGVLARWRQGSWLLQWGETIGMVLAALVFGLAPFVSTSLIGVLMAACGAFWVLLTLAEDGKPGITPIHVLIVVYGFIALLATAQSPVKVAAAAGLAKWLLNGVLFLLLARVLRSPILRSSLLTIYLLVVSIVSVYGMRQWFFGAAALATWVDAESSLAGTTRVYSFLGNPNLLAGYLISACVMSAAAVFVWQRWLPKALALGLFLLNSACLVLTFSRGGWIGYVFGGFVFLILLVHWFSWRLPRFWQRWAVPVVLLASLGFLVVAVAAVDPLRDRVLSMFAGREDSSNNFRINVWASVRQMIADRPILGIGPGNTAFTKIYPSYQQAGFTALSAYSIFLEVLVETGIIGFVCFLWLLTVTFNLGWQQIQRLRQVRDVNAFWLMGAIASMVGMLSHGLVDTVWYRPQVSTLWWLMLALVASYYPFISSNTASPAKTTETTP